MAKTNFTAPTNALLARVAEIQDRAKERFANQSELFDTTSDTPLSPAELMPSTQPINVQEENRPGTKRERSKLLPVRHVDRDFFLCDMFDYAMKDDGVSMEAPIFTLSTKPDLNIWHWESKDGNKTLTVTPSVKGRATQHDKDVLIFIVSQMTEAINCGRQDAKNKVVRFVVYDFLTTTNKTASGNEYYRLSEAFERLRGTSITTDIRTGGTRVREGFGLIDKWKIIEKSPGNERMIAVEITMSDWLFNAVQAQEVLTIHRNYFRLRKPLERRLYELARKHCGKQAAWSIGLELLREKCGAHSHIRSFRSQAINIAASDVLPEYRMLYDREKDQVTFYIRDAKKLLAAVASSKSKLPGVR
jgi:plasmid replication initiation protein